MGGTVMRVFLVAFLVLLVTAACSPAEQARQAAEEGEKAREQAEQNSPGEDIGPVEATEDTSESSEQVYQELLRKFDAPEIPPKITPEDSYKQRLVKFGENYSECSREVSESKKVCEKPASLKRDLKQNINIELVLDASGSMQAPVSGERKIDIARRVLIDFVDTLPETANVGLRVYGHKGSNAEADRDESCAASELIFPFQELDTAGLTDAINSFDPRGWTPVAGSLDKAREDFSGRDPETNSNFVYLVSDGVETCGGDPVAAAEKLAADDVQAEVNIIGFDIDAEAADQLKRAAESGGGSFYDAADAAELQEAFENYNWSEWSEYYACVWDKAYSDYNETWDVSYGNYNCIWDKAYREYNNMWDDAYGEYNDVWDAERGLYNKISEEVNGNEVYDQHREYVLDKARERRDTSIEEEREDRDYTVEQAREKRDGLVDSAREARDSAVDPARTERDRAVDEAREQRDENIGDQ